MESSMDKIRSYLIVWVLGVIVGVVLVERWRRTGAFDPATANAEYATGDTGPLTQLPANKPNAAAAIIVGAKADAKHVWGVVTQLTPKARAPAAPFTRLRRSTHPGAPASTAAPPA
jgi:hypothetical protein